MFTKTRQQKWRRNFFIHEKAYFSCMSYQKKNSINGLNVHLSKPNYYEFRSWKHNYIISQKFHMLSANWQHKIPLPAPCTSTWHSVQEDFFPWTPVLNHAQGIKFTRFQNNTWSNQVREREGGRGERDLHLWKNDDCTKWRGNYLTNALKLSHLDIDGLLVKKEC